MENKVISIIIPVYNNAQGLDRVLSAIEMQDYPTECIEVLVVDNGSNDEPDKIAYRHQVTFLTEKKYLGSPYSARNRGLEKARGDVLVFLDTTCVPSPKWIKEGVKCLENGFDLLGGKVVFDVDHESPLGEIYDAVSNVKIKETIEERNAALGGNLFVRKKVFDQMGFFEEGLRSGGDIRWTSSASKTGFKLGYCDEAIVTIQPRKFKKIIQKAIRVAKGHPVLWKENKLFYNKFFKKVILFWVPPDPFYLMKNIRQSSFPSASRYFVQLYFMRYFIRIISAYGFVTGIVKMIIDKK